MRSVTGLTLLALLSPSVYAWGPEGHEIVARIAMHFVSSDVKSKISTVIGSDPDSADWAALSNWADTIRPFRTETAPWHFVDIPITRKTYQPSTDCANDDCVVAQIVKDVQDLSSGSGSQLDAFRFLVHFTGDIHQPLHCADNNDRGGNNVHVHFHDETTNLHRVWDSGMLDQLPEKDQLIADLVRGITAANQAEWAAGEPKDWAVESHLLAIKPGYSLVPKRAGRSLPVLEESYEEAGDPVVEIQLQRAGVRLAMLLTKIYGGI